MSDAVKVGFVPLSTTPRGVLVVFCDDALKLGAATRKMLGTAAGLVKRRRPGASSRARAAPCSTFWNPKESRFSA